MALAKDLMPHGLSSPGPYAVDEEGAGACSLDNTSGLIKNLAISSTTSNGFVFRGTNYQPEAAHSLINFKSGYGNLMQTCESLLSFEQSERTSGQNAFLKSNNHKDEYSMWEDDLSHNNYQWNQTNPKCSTGPRLSEELNCFQTASNYSSISNTTTKENQHEDGPYGWLYSGATVVADIIQESGTHETSFHKRPHMGESMQALKKQCNSATKKAKPKSSSSSSDPQSIAAKNRRERISERLKILQELVPNGSKVDLVTMLEKAISYVKFLQLQVKVLATDEFWPVQGGKAPDISQVKEAVDAILSCQRDRNSSSK